MAGRSRSSLAEESLDLLDLGGNESLLLGVGGLPAAEPLLALRVLEDQVGGLADNLTDGLVLADGTDAVGVGADGGVSLLPELHHVLGLGGLEALLPLAELSLEPVGIGLLELVVVVLHVLAHDVVLVDLDLELSLVLFLLFELLAALVGLDLGLDHTEAGEALLLVGHVDAAVVGSLHGAEDTVTSGGAHETNIKVSLEGAALGVLVLDGVEGTVDLGLSDEHGVHLLLLEETAGAEEAGGVGSGVAGETGSDAEAAELLGVGAGHGAIALEGGEDDGANDAAVGAAHCEAVLLGVVLVLVLEDETATSLVVGLAFAATAALGLVAAAVGRVLEDFHECHRDWSLIIISPHKTRPLISVSPRPIRGGEPPQR